MLAYNEQTGNNGYYPITAVHKNNDPAITYLEIKDPEQGNKSEFITTTPEHPFYLQVNADASARSKPKGYDDLSSKWVGAGHLIAGDKIKQADGTSGVIANVVTVKQTQEMFNLTVSEAHTFYVGNEGWLVHNCSLLKGRLRIDPEGSFSQSEINSAWDVAAMGRKVELRSPQGVRSPYGNTSDLLVDGVPYDVYTPTLNNPEKIFQYIRKKNNQAQGVVVDLRNVNVTPAQLANVQARLNGNPRNKIKEVIFLK